MRKILIILCVCLVSCGAQNPVVQGGTVQDAPALRPLSWEVIEETMHEIYTRFVEARKREPSLQEASSVDPDPFNIFTETFDNKDHFYTVHYLIDLNYYATGFSIAKESSTRTFGEVTDFLASSSFIFFEAYGEPVRSGPFMSTWECPSWYDGAIINYLAGNITLIIPAENN